MKTTLFCGIFNLFLALTSSAQTYETNSFTLKDYGVKSGVQSTQTYLGFYTQDSLGNFKQDSAQLDSELIFNEKGQIIEKNSYSYDGSLANKFIFEYDATGSLLKFNVYHPEGAVKKTWTYQYSENDQLIERNYYTKGSLTYTWRYQYDDQGNQIEINYHKGNGLLIHSTRSKYDALHNEVETNRYDLNGNLMFRWRYRYDDHRNKIEESTYSGERITKQITWVYDSYNNVVEEQSTYWYGKNDVVKKKIKFEYIYDLKGNWTTKYQVKNEEPDYHYKRIITYSD